MMKAQLIQAAAWVNGDARRVKVIAAVVTAALLVVATVAPGAVAFAGPVGGGSDVGGL